MTKHFLKYWLYTTLEENENARQPYMTHSASDQFDKVEVGDQMWFVTIPRGTQQLLLTGHMIVGWTGNRKETALRLDVTENSLWDSSNFVTEEPVIRQPYHLIDISDIALDLRFNSSTGRDRLTEINGQSLQAMRELKSESVILLQSIWDDELTYIYETNQGGSISATEGHLKLRLHYERERNHRIVELAKTRFKEAHKRLFCEICGFDFSDGYGERGEDFIEVHHRTPLAEIEGTVETKIEDLAMVCANCHRMLHRRKPYLSIEELKSMLLNK